MSRRKVNPHLRPKRHAVPPMKAVLLKYPTRRKSLDRIFLPAPAKDCSQPGIIMVIYPGRGAKRPARVRAGLALELILRCCSGLLPLRTSLAAPPGLPPSGPDLLLLRIRGLSFSALLCRSLSCSVSSSVASSTSWSPPASLSASPVVLVLASNIQSLSSEIPSPGQFLVSLLSGNSHLFLQGFELWLAFHLQSCLTKTLSPTIARKKSF